MLLVRSPWGGILGRPTNQISATVLSDAKVRTIQSFVRLGAQECVVLFTDAATSHQRTPECRGEGTRQSVLGYVLGQVNTNGLASFWSMLKWADTDVFKFSRKPSPRHVHEWFVRQSIPEQEVLEPRGTVTVALAVELIRYRDVIGTNAPFSGAQEASL